VVHRRELAGAEWTFFFAKVGSPETSRLLMLVHLPLHDKQKTKHHEQQHSPYQTDQRQPVQKQNAQSQGGQTKRQQASLLWFNFLV
jgi:hypothetical protein